MAARPHMYCLNENLTTLSPEYRENKVSLSHTTYPQSRLQSASRTTPSSSTSKSQSLMQRKNLISTQWFLCPSSWMALTCQTSTPITSLLTPMATSLQFSTIFNFQPASTSLHVANLTQLSHQSGLAFPVSQRHTSLTHNLVLYFKRPQHLCHGFTSLMTLWFTLPHQKLKFISLVPQHLAKTADETRLSPWQVMESNRSLQDAPWLCQMAQLISHPTKASTSLK